MTEVNIVVADAEYTILQCSEDAKLSTRVSCEYPNCILLRQCTLDIIGLIQNKFESADISRFLISGTPGIGKTVSIIVLLYLAVKDLLKVSFTHIIADVKRGCALFIRDPAKRTWSEQMFDRNSLNICAIEQINGTRVLYLYDAFDGKQPLLLPYCSVVFSSPNLQHFKEFINIDILLRMIYYMPVWSWDEIEAVYLLSPALQRRTSLNDVKNLFANWGGLPRHIFCDYATGMQALNDSVSSCDAVACIQVLEKGWFLSYNTSDRGNVRSKLMQFEVMDDKKYTNAMVNFGSPYIRDKLVIATGKEFSGYYRDFMITHGFNAFAAKVRGNLYEKIVLDRLRDLSSDMDVPSFVMKKGNLNSKMIIRKIRKVENNSFLFGKLADITHDEGIWIPSQSNFKSFDVLVSTVRPPWWVQITVGETHSLNAVGVHECMTCTNGGTVVFCLPPDIFTLWYEKNSVQNFVNQDRLKSSIHQYLNDMEQLVICIPGDAVEAEMLKTIMNENT
jgi:hypothetical protein